MTTGAGRRAPRPPRVAERLLAFLLPQRDRDPIVGDLAEEFAARAETSERAARWWYRRHVVRSMIPALRRRGRRPAANPVGRLVARAGSVGLDVKLGVRMLVKYPGLTVVAILALAAGIPAGVAPFHLARAWDRPPPVDQGERLHVLRNIDSEIAVVRPTALFDFQQWRDSLASYSGIAATIDGAYNVTPADGVTAPVEGVEVTASFFDVMRVAPLLGRTLVATDDDQGAPDVVVIGHDVWNARMRGDPAIVGQTLDVGGVQRTVVGVMPEGFRYPWSDQIWIPLREQAFDDEHAGARMVRVIARLKDGVTPEEAQAELTSVGVRMTADHPDAHGRLRAEAAPFAAGIVRLPKGGLQSLPFFYPIQVLMVLLLLFPSINIGMLVLARTAARSSELAVRMALGASRARVVMQLFLESLVLTVLGGGFGFLALAFAGRYLGNPDDTNWIDFGLTAETALLALALAGVSAAVVGAAPALKLTRSRSLGARLQRASGGRSTVRFGSISTALIVMDVALAVAIFGVGVGIWNDDPRGGMGIDADQYLFAELRIPRVEPGVDRQDMSRSEGTRLVAAERAFMERVATEPGVGRVAVADVMPGMDHNDLWFEMDDGSRRQEVLVARVDIGYFDALEQPILMGRGFTVSDLGARRSTVIVNTSFVERMLGGGNPIGRQVRQAPRGGTPGPWLEIVGVVGHLGMFAGEPDRDSGIYFPLAPGEVYPVRFVVRAGDDPTAFTPRLRALAREADPNAVIWSPMALGEVFNLYTFVQTRLQSAFLIIAGILLAISTMAIYALMSFTVAQRRREIGIRIALGAGWREVVSAIARRALLQLGSGALAGLALAWVLLSILRSVLGQTSVESPILVASAVAVAVVAVIGPLACLTPTRRALRIAPSEALADN